MMSFKSSTKLFQRKDITRIAEEILSAAKLTAGATASASSTWQILQKELSNKQFEVHKKCYEEVYAGINDVKPAWVPSLEDSKKTNIFKSIAKENKF